MKRAALAEPDHMDQKCVKMSDDAVVTQLEQDRADARVKVLYRWSPRFQCSISRGVATRLPDGDCPLSCVAQRKPRGNDRTHEVGLDVLHSPILDDKGNVEWRLGSLASAANVAHSVWNRGTAAFQGVGDDS